MWTELTPEELAALPRAPDQATWDALTPAERARVVAALPSLVIEAGPPEGDFHSAARLTARETLEEFFRKRRPGVYIGSDLAVYYPAAQRCYPDLFVVFDVDPGPRDAWVVSHEGKGLDFVLEVIYHGHRRKDLVDNVAFYASLGIPEYFIYDLPQQRLLGHRLAEGTRRYLPILPQYGRYASASLGMDLVLEDGGLQFYLNNARLLSPRDLAVRLREALTDVELRKEEERAAREAAERAQEAERTAREVAEKRLAEALAELERLRGH